MARQVGWAMHGCPPGLSWHRVVGAGGRILTHSLCPVGGSERQRQLLEQEEVAFVGRHVDMRLHQFVPPKGFLKHSPQSKRSSVCRTKPLSSVR